MKRFAFSLLALALSTTAFAPLAKAQSVEKFSPSPFNVASLAYQGQLRNEGIPGYAALEAGLRSGSITSDTVIEAAIQVGQLPENIREDNTFVTAVEHQLDNLVERSN